MPAELKAVMDSCMTMSRTKHSGHNQGGDGCLEEINKDSKSWLKVSGGVPDDERWLRIFRNLTKLKEVSTLFLMNNIFSMTVYIKLALHQGTNTGSVSQRAEHLNTLCVCHLVRDFDACKSIPTSYM